ncbi:hypothetical protein [Burkholderia sp. NRF60-BP8]|uniref:hypothetical protein n=1 Tax=Burkholderia sp. NRF60-BP8 TaxID=1637853 RepID=UPI0007586397|nr:hypothetical protein [Burkholderia sp. NRF60-BP8]AOI76084.1 hypothetical protein WS54_07235 [Burkholderia sp. NRF60-BP8]KVA07108.1 hypothetical protein WS54_23370 [Burkholderia sp. NRF60-BP8]
MSEIKHIEGRWELIETPDDKMISDWKIVIGADSISVFPFKYVKSECDKFGGYVMDRERLSTYRLMTMALDMAEVLEKLAADADDGKAKIPSGTRAMLDAALIKAGRKAAPTAVRHVTIAGVDRDPPRYCSFCFEADCNGECSGDGAMGD